MVPVASSALPPSNRLDLSQVNQAKKSGLGPSLSGYMVQHTHGRKEGREEVRLPAVVWRGFTFFLLLCNMDGKMNDEGTFSFRRPSWTVLYR